MVVWQLAPGEEHPLRRKEPLMSTVALSGLTPEKIARRAEALGAVVEIKGSKYCAFMPGSGLPKVHFVRLQGHAGQRDVKNLLSDLRKAGIDILAEPKKETPPMAPTTNAPARTNGAPINPLTVMPKTGPSDTPMTGGGLALQDRLVKAEQKIADLLDLMTQNDTDRDSQIGALTARLKVVEARLAATPGVPPVRDINADLDAAIMEFMAATPIILTTPVIHANLKFDVKVNANQVGKRLQSLATAGKVIQSGDAGQRVYKLPAQLKAA